MRELSRSFEKLPLCKKSIGGGRSASREGETDQDRIGGEMGNDGGSKKSSLETAREWFVEHKLRAVGGLWLSGIAGSIAYNWSRPDMKTSVKIIHARLHAQALTLAALAGAAVVEYHDHQTGRKADRYAQFLNLDDPHHE